MTFGSVPLQLFRSGNSSYFAVDAQGASVYAGLLLNRSSASPNNRMWAIDNEPDPTNTSGFLGFATYSDAGFPTARMAILRSGNVGIGTTTPGSRLTVTGVIESTSGGVKFPDGTTQTTATAVGPQGPAGPAGATGPQGPVGPTGNTGAAGPQGPAGNTGATGPQGPAGAQGVVGPQGPAGAPGPTGPQGVVGAQGPQGVQGPAGAQGPAGPAGVVSISGFSGSIGDITGSNTFVFAGPTGFVSVTNSQRLTGAATAALGSTVSNAINMGLCYQSIPGGTITIFANSITVAVSSRQTYSATASVTGLAAGSYNIGFCVKLNPAQTLDNDNVVNGWVMVTN